MTVLDKWKEIVAATTEWQTIVGTMSAEAAAAFIYARGVETASFPCMTCWKSNTRFTKIGDLSTTVVNGEIGFNIHVAYDGELGADWDAKRAELEEMAEGLFSAIMILAGTGEYLDLREITLATIVEPNEREKTNPFASIECTASWGVEA